MTVILMGQLFAGNPMSFKGHALSDSQIGSQQD